LNAKTGSFFVGGANLKETIRFYFSKKYIYLKKILTTSFPVIAKAVNIEHEKTL